MFSSLLDELLTETDVQTIILLPQITASSIKQLLNIISTGSGAEEQENTIDLETAELIGVLKRENVECVEEIENIVKY